MLHACIYLATLIGAPRTVALPAVSMRQSTSITLKAEGMPIRDLLRELFKQAQASYQVSPEVQGNVTISINGKPFFDALKLVLEKVDASYRYDPSGFYMIEKASQKGPKDVDLNEVIIQDIQFDRVDIRDAMRAFFRNVGKQYTVDTDVAGTVTGDYKMKGAAWVLVNMLNQVGCIYRIDGGVVQIVKLPPVESSSSVQPGAIQFNHMEIREALHVLLAGGPNPMSYFVSPKVEGFVDGAYFGSDPLTAAKTICSLAGATIERRNGILVVLPEMQVTFQILPPSAFGSKKVEVRVKSIKR